MSIPSITNTQTAGVQNSISNILENSSTIANKLASGQAVIFPYEDPAGLAIGTKLEINLGVQKEALKSAHQASVVLNIAYGGTKGVVNILKRLDQLSIMALTGSASDSDRKLINLEAQQLKAEVNRISTATEFNSRKLINGETSESVTFNAANEMKLKIDNDDKSGIFDAQENKILSYTKATGTTEGKFAINESTKNPGFIDDISGNKLYQIDGTDVKSRDGTKTLFSFDTKDAVKKITSEGKDLFSIDAKAAVPAAGATAAVPASTVVSNAATADQTKFNSYNFEGDDPVGNPMVFQVGVEADQRVAIGFDNVDTKSLGIDKIELTSVKSAEDAQAQIGKTLETMFNYNSKIGAYQSRFRMVAESISTAIENVDAARAQFLDADFTQLTKDFSQEQAKLTASIAAEAKLIQTPHKLLQLLQSLS
ncbi:MAG: flagellin [Candidatus Midichloriaceae bacterium]